MVIGNYTAEEGAKKRVLKGFGWGLARKVVPEVGVLQGSGKGKHASDRSSIRGLQGFGKGTSSSSRGLIRWYLEMLWRIVNQVSCAAAQPVYLAQLTDTQLYIPAIFLL